jgi:putative membrane protein
MVHAIKQGMNLSATTLHATPPVSLLDAWEFEPYIILLLVFAAGFYALALRKVRDGGVRRVPWYQPLAFYGGLLAFSVALGGPLHTYNQNSFAMHMSQHVVMMLVAAPLLVLGRPVHLFLHALGPNRSGVLLRPVLRRRWVRGTLTVLTHPLLVLLLFNVNLALWHVPRFYVAALESTLVHEAEHMLFFGLSLLFWWVIIDPIPRHHRLRTEHAILVLFTTAAVGDLLGLLLMFSTQVLYSYYSLAEPIWGLSTLDDQRLGGLIMLLSGVVVYYGAIIVLIVRAFRQQATHAPSPAGSMASSPVQQPAD